MNLLRRLRWATWGRFWCWAVYGHFYADGTCVWCHRSGP